MNFIVKQALKSKTGGITDKLDEVTKKCKDMLEDDPEPATNPALSVSEEDQIRQEVFYF